MNKTILLLMLVLALSSIAVSAAELKLTCPGSATIGKEVSCTLAFTAPQSFLSVQGKLTISSKFQNSVAISAMPTAGFVGEYDTSTKVLIISDDVDVKGAAGVTTIATLGFVPQVEGSAVLSLTIDETLNQNIKDISLTTSTLSSGAIAISAAVAEATSAEPVQSQVPVAEPLPSPEPIETSVSSPAPSFSLPVCGNAQQESGELCDGVDVGIRTCVSEDKGYVSGTLKCSSDCTSLDYSACVQEEIKSLSTADSRLPAGTDEKSQFLNEMGKAYDQYQQEKSWSLSLISKVAGILKKYFGT